MSVTPNLFNGGVEAPNFPMNQNSKFQRQLNIIVLITSLQLRLLSQFDEATGGNVPSNYTPTPLGSSGSTRHPAGRRLMTLCLPSNRLFDKALAHLMRTTLLGVATGSEECDGAHTHTHTQARTCTL